MNERSLCCTDSAANSSAEWIDPRLVCELSLKKLDALRTRRKDVGLLRGLLIDRVLANARSAVLTAESTPSPVCPLASVDHTDDVDAVSGDDAKDTLPSIQPAVVRHRTVDIQPVPKKSGTPHCVAASSLSK